MLHILRNSPFKININFMVKMILPKDNIIALQDGVLIIFKKKFFCLKKKFSNIKIYLLEEDVIARGISKYVGDNFILIGYDEFIQLTIQYRRYMNW